MASDLDGTCFLRKGNAFLPADFRAEEQLAKVKDGNEIIISWRRPRSPEHHRRFFALLRKVVSNTELWRDEAHLLEDLKDRLGMYDITVNAWTQEGRKCYHSIAFASMAQDDFNRFYDQCVFHLTTLLGWDPEDLMAEVDETQRMAGAGRNRRTKS
jgi:hypothetical protein